MNESPGMRDGTGSEAKRPPLWPSLLFAAVVATVCSVAWLTRGPDRLIDFRLLLAPIYIPLAFGILWPVTVALQALAMPSARDRKLWRNWVAMILFAASVCCWVPFVTAEMAESRNEREAVVRQAAWQRQQQAERADAQAAIARAGISAFTEPLTEQQSYVLQQYIDAHRLSAEEIMQASEHYQTPSIMAQLAQTRDCPPEALEVLFEHALNQQKTISEALQPSQLGEVFGAIGKNANTPVHVLVEMMRIESPYVRAAAVENPNLPGNVKLAYLKKGCELWWPSELRTVGSDPETPLDVLVCLSTKPDAAYSVARNPHTPTSVVETMSKSENYWLKTAGKEELDKRLAKKL